MRTPLLPWFILWVTIPIIILFLFILPAHASDGPFYQRGQEGWFGIRSFLNLSSLMS